MSKLTIYEKYKDRIADHGSSRLSPMQTGIIVADGANPLVGIGYQCDFKAEEEWGTSDLRQKFLKGAAGDNFFLTQSLKYGGEQSKVKQVDLVAETDEYVLFSTEYRSGSDVPQAAKDSIARRQRRRGIDFAEDELPLVGSSVTDLKNTARDLKIRGFSKMNHEQLVDAVLDVRRNVADGEPHNGWFQSGSVLVLPKTNDVYGEVLADIVEAAREGYVVVSPSALSPFGSSLAFFDSRDLTSEQRDDIAKDQAWYYEKMDELEPVKKVVADRDGYFALGSPRIDSNGEVVYWLNGQSIVVNNQRVQPYGWYTLDQLSNRDYVANALEKEAKRA